MQGESVSNKGRLGCVAVALLGLCGWWPVVAGAETLPAESGSAGSPIPSESSTTTDVILESTSRTVRSTVEWLARGIDGTFGDKPFSEGGKVSDGRIGLSLLTREDRGASTNVRFNARLRLPNLERYHYLFIGNDDRRAIVTDQPNDISQQELIRQNTRVEDSFFAGIGVWLEESIDLRLGFRGGLKPYAQARYRRPWQLGPSDLIEARETIFLTVADRFGSTTALSYEHGFSPEFAFRWLNAATITQKSRKLNWASTLGLYQSFGEERVLGLEALMNGIGGADVPVADYGVQVKWDQPVYKRALYGEVVVGHFWPRPTLASPREGAWAFGGVITLRF